MTTSNSPENLTLSQEGFADIWTKITKWFKRRYSSEASRLQIATDKVGALLPQVQELGAYGRDIASLVSKGMFSNQRTLDAIGRSAFKNPIVTEKYLDKTQTYYRRLTANMHIANQRVSARILADLYAPGSKFLKELRTIVDFFVHNRTHLQAYLTCARKLDEVHDHKDNQRLIKMSLAIKELKEMVAALPFLEIGLVKALGSYSTLLKPTDALSSPAGIEKSLMESGYLNLLNVFSTINGSGLRDVIEEILDSWNLHVTRSWTDADFIDRSEMEYDYSVEETASVMISISEEAHAHYQAEVKPLLEKGVGPIKELFYATEIFLDYGHVGQVLHRLMMEAQQDYLEEVLKELKSHPQPVTTSLESHSMTDVPANVPNA